MGKNRHGLMMPGLVLLGASYFQEIASETAMDPARIISGSNVPETPAGRLVHCLMTE